MQVTSKHSMKKKLRPQTIERGSEEEAQMLAKLEADIAKADNDYVSFVKENDKYLNPANTQMQEMMRMRHMQMFSACFRPLQRGVNPTSIVQCLGMYAGMRLLDKDFKKDVQKSVATMLEPVVTQRAETLMAQGDPASVRWKGYADRLKAVANGGRPPLDADSVAITHLAFIQKANNDMRQPNADINKIMTDYQAGLDTLYARAAQDGISKDDAEVLLKFKIGKAMERNPDLGLCFNETAYQGIRQGDYQEETTFVTDTSGQTKEVNTMAWHGEFVNADGSEFEGTFSPRIPMAEDAYRSMAGSIMTEHCVNGLNDIDEKYVQAMQDMIQAEVNQANADMLDSRLQDIEIRAKRTGMTEEEKAEAIRDVKKSVYTGNPPSYGEDTIADGTQKQIADLVRMSCQYSIGRKDSPANEQIDNFRKSMLSDNFSMDDCNGMLHDAFKVGTMDAYDTIVKVMIDRAYQTSAKEHATEYEPPKKQSYRNYHRKGPDVSFDTDDMDSYDYGE